MTAVVLFSGGLDSTTLLAYAVEQESRVLALSFDYGQRHRAEVRVAEQIVAHYDVEWLKVDLDMSPVGHSALLDSSLSIPEGFSDDIPITYVPGRNLLMLSYAVSLAESRSFRHVYIGANAVDYSGYPDCRPAFFEAFNQTIACGMKCSEEAPIVVKTPLIDKSKAEIIAMGLALGVDYSQTVSCYQASDSAGACGVCEACLLRKRGFEQARVADPTCYV